LHQAVVKRWSRLGYDSLKLDTTLQLPSVSIDRRSLPLETDGNRVGVKVDARGDGLSRLNVWVNDVPLYGTAGNPIDGTRWNGEVAVPLSSGRNKIQVSVRNTYGLESLKETAEIRSTVPSSPRTFVLAIGVSSYRDAAMNLNYAAKDAADLAQFFSSFAEGRALLDADVTRENIRAMRPWLDSTGVNDRVIVFFAGHGLIDEQFNWYFATHDVDFHRPADRGLEYEDIEKLLDGIPARQKLLLLDACHSGELDTSEVSLLAETGLRDGALKGRAFKTVRRRIGLEPSFELMRQLFADLQRGSGASVVSSASGIEWAYEGGEWTNGVFTYVLLDGLKNGHADANRDRRVSVTEIADYVARRVPELTGGRQNPTARRESREFDFDLINR
jgi:hypothetical protein